MKRPIRLLPILFCAVALTACGSDNATDDTGSTSISSSSGKVTLGVNSYLWHASLDTLRFMPLASADPYGGVIITDWYTAPQDVNERLKVTVYILDRKLRADGIKIAVFRQSKTAAGTWADAATNPDTANKLEDAILTRARELRLASQNSGS
ncbi:MAG TPA: DUF3576 domain-containing protein [Rhizomicrobium sp.]|nr:DUF3576 domain-containing protein [Rhizomicrobium sp.]